MTKLILHNNYILKTSNSFCPNKIRNVINGTFKLLNIKNGNTFVFTDGNNTFTLWSNHRYCENWTCYITHQKNNKYRTTKYELNSNSIYIRVKVLQLPLEIRYLQSYKCIVVLQKYTSLIDFYNKTIDLGKNRNPESLWENEFKWFINECKKIIPLYPERCFWTKDFYNTPDVLEQEK